MASIGRPPVHRARISLQEVFNAVDELFQMNGFEFMGAWLSHRWAAGRTAEPASCDFCGYLEQHPYSSEQLVGLLHLT